MEISRLDSLSAVSIVDNEVIFNRLLRLVSEPSHIWLLFSLTEPFRAGLLVCLSLRRSFTWGLADLRFMVGLSICKLVKSVGIHRDGLLEMSVSDGANFNSSGGVSLPGDIWFSVEE